MDGAGRGRPRVSRRRRTARARACRGASPPQARVCRVAVPLARAARTGDHAPEDPLARVRGPGHRSVACRRSGDCPPGDAPRHKGDVRLQRGGRGAPDRRALRHARAGLERVRGRAGRSRPRRAERAASRAGYGAIGGSQRVRLRAANDADAGAPRGRGGPVRTALLHGSVDAPLARIALHRPVRGGGGGRLGDAASPRRDDPRGMAGRGGVRDRGLRGEPGVHVPTIRAPGR